MHNKAFAALKAAPAEKQRYAYVNTIEKVYEN